MRRRRDVAIAAAASGRRRGLLCGSALIGALVVAASQAHAGAVTVNPVQSTQYTLTPSDNPITFGPGTNINTNPVFSFNVPLAVDGDTSTAWAVTNQGSLIGGIWLHSDGTLDNAGTIQRSALTDTSDGFALAGASIGTQQTVQYAPSAYEAVFTPLGTITNESGGSISGDFVGAQAAAIINKSGATISSELEGASANTVTNAGTITGAYGGLGLGDFINNVAGALNNEAGGVITTTATSVTTQVVVDGVQTSGAATILPVAVYALSGSSITNAGTISSINQAIAFGLETDLRDPNDPATAIPGSSVTNLSTGQIIGDITADQYVPLAVTNAGSIQGSITLNDGGAVNNQASGAISGAPTGPGDAVAVPAGQANVFNAGAITSTRGVGVDLEEGGALVNYQGGTINGWSAGVVVSNIPGAVVNAGVIENPQGAVGVQALGQVVNETGGQILSGGANAPNGVAVMLLSGSTLSNSGLISGTLYGVYASPGASVTNQAGGSITGGAYGQLYGVSADQVANEGLIAAAAVAVEGVRTLDNSGVISQAPDAHYGVLGGVAVAAVDGGVVDNTGSISGQTGVEFNRAPGVSGQAPGGSLTNEVNGVITGNVVADQYAPLTLTNAGLMEGGGPGAVVLADGGNVTNQSGGSIISSTSGVVIGGAAGSVINAGYIRGLREGAVVFDGPGANILTLQTGSFLQGDAVGSTQTGATNALVLQGSGMASNDFLNFTSLDVQAGGLWVLNGAASVGSAMVDSGDLEIGDAGHPNASLTGSVTVNTGATLSGHGTIIGSVSNDGGTVSPGGTIGTLTIDGNYAQSSTGTLSIETSPTATSTLVVTGQASLAGSLVLVDDPGVYRKGQTFDVLTAGSVSGGFTSVTGTNGLPLSLALGPTGVTTTALAGNFAAAGATPSEAAIGAAFNQIPVGAGDFDPVADAVIGLGAGPAQNAALDALGGEVYADLLTAGREADRQFLGGMTDRIGDGGASDPAVFGQVYGRFDSVGSNGGAHGFSSTAGGGLTGAERDWPDAVLGLALGYDHTDLSLKGLSQSGRLDVVAMGAFGERRFGAGFIDLAGSLGYDQGQGSRDIVFPGVNRHASDDFDGVATGLEMKFGARVPAGDGWRAEPSAAILQSSVRANGSLESGAGGADLAIDGRSQSSIESLVGVRLDKAVTVRAASVAYGLDLDWAHELGPIAPRIDESFPVAPGTGFALPGAETGRDRWIVGAGVTCATSKRVTVFARYDADMSRSQSGQSLNAGFRVSW